jgi:hypothetical protein
MEAKIFSPIKSDVHIYIEKEHSMFDSTISSVFNELKIKQLLSKANITKRCGINTINVVYDLFTVPFLMISTVCLFVRNQFEEAAGKDVYYRFLDNANYNWHQFIIGLSGIIERNLTMQAKRTEKREKPEKFFVIDDTITEISGKLVEKASYVYDHTKGKSVLGFQKLVLGLFSADRFIPLISKICISSKRPNKKSKATKYIKKSKEERIRPDSPGAIERADLDKNKLEKTLSMLKEAKKKFKDVGYVLFDSWFAFNCFIAQIKSIEIDVICQLKNMPKANSYIYNGNKYSLNGLYALVKNNMRTVKKYGYKQTSICVGIPKTELQMKIVFIHNDGELGWHAFASTNISFSAKKTLEYYSKRWSIEVFYKNCKQYLNFGKEQMSNLDSIIASDALVFMRYLVLTYLSALNNTGFFETLEQKRLDIKILTYGTRLLNFFLNQLKYYVDCICEMISQNKNNEAIELLRNIFNPTHIPQLEFVNLK